ncbi:MAG TPA: peptidylprolyl isomerase, partial [Planctomycetaceae bacterium]
EPGESPEKAPTTAGRLDAIRRRIVSGETTFAEAAKAHSQAPTAVGGGDVGWIGPRGDLPSAVTRAAYALEPGAVSEVVLSPFGAHLVTVTEVEPGDLSLEDARPAILDELSEALWAETVAAERKIAKIVVAE